MAPPGSAPDPSSPRSQIPPAAPSRFPAPPRVPARRRLCSTPAHKAPGRGPQRPRSPPVPRRAGLSPKLTPCPAASSHRHHLPPPPALKLPAHTTRGGAAPRPARPRPAAASRSGGADHRGTSGERTGGGPAATHTPPRGRGTGQCASPPSPPCLVRPGRPRPRRGGRGRGGATGAPTVGAAGRKGLRRWAGREGPPNGGDPGTVPPG